MNLPANTTEPKHTSISRRRFIGQTASAFAFTVVPSHVLAGRGNASPNEKLNIAAIGAGGMGGSNLNNCATENIVALCDVDEERAAGSFKKFAGARKYTDFRKMFDKEDKNIDAVIVATPDHTHAVVAIQAIRMGKHAYVQKPLAHTIKEVRTLTEAAKEAGVQTQMGNQGHSTDDIRNLYEWIHDGVIGPIHEVYTWSDRPVGGQPWSDFPIMARPKETPPVPKGLDWDLWLGPVAYRPYHPIYCPTTWRGWVDFGTGSLGDMGCHILDPAFWALKLGHPTSVQASTTHYQREISSETYPRAATVRYQFPARGTMPPVKLTWFDGRLKPPIPEMWDPGRSLGTNGAIFVGEKGVLSHGSHGAGGLRISPKSLNQSYRRPLKTIPRVKNGSGGHEQDWIRACKDGKPASSSFEYGGALTETVLLGVLAERMPDQKLDWDGSAMRFTNNEKANGLVHIDYRAGWHL